MLLVYAVLLLVQSLMAQAAVHRQGYCAMYDNCGKKSVFGSPLPCPANVEAVQPDAESIQLLKDICGAEFPTEAVCCSKDQILNLESNLKKVDPLISSCPACRKNFYNFFCEFTCSPDQSLFINVTKTGVAADTKAVIVTELTQYVNPEKAAQFYDSCKTLKFSATNGYAMDLIGGGAKNYSQLLKFLGDEKPLLGGSPFQINFAYGLNKEENGSGLILREPEMRDCNDEVYKCACSDCLESCPTLPSFTDFTKTCKVGAIHCFSFSMIITMISIILLIGGFHVYLAKMRRKVPEHELLDEDLDVTVSPSTFALYKAKSYNWFYQYHGFVVEKTEHFFKVLGLFCSLYPQLVIGSTLFISLLLSTGIYWLEFETDPVHLWVSPDEPHLKNLEYFEDRFGEWYRIEQIIVSNKNESSILNWDNVQWWFEKELQLQLFVDETLNETFSLDDFCFKPLGDACVIESFTQYFGGDINYLNEKNWAQKIKDCTDSPVNCLPSFQQPLKKNLLFDRDDVFESKAFVVTILLNNNRSNSEYTDKVTKYEANLRDWVLNLQEAHTDLNIAFSTELSLTQELNKSTNTDIKIIVISYLAMFLYASIALGGRIPSKLSLRALISTRFQLGFSGILIVLLSVTSSVGIFSLIGLKSTLIIAEVIPFLVLAIGIDNIFLIVHELHLVDANFQSESIPERISRALSNIGPSCLMSAVLQISVFLLASQVDMPAVKNFAFYSAGAIFVNFVLQMTAFVSLLSIDQKRIEAGRCDVLWWIKPPVLLNDNEVHAVEYNFGKLLRKYYAPKVLTKTAKPKILTLFILWLGASLSLLPYIELGLDQRLALPRESYLVNYFDCVYKYLNVGPPAFFVVQDLNVTARSNQQKLCGKFSTCEEFSLANVLEQEFKRSNLSLISDPTANWLDDFLTWLNPNLDQCCRFKKGTNEFCSPRAPERQCETCYLSHDPPYSIDMEGLPEGEEFMKYFKQWINEPSDPCPLGGKAPYGTAVAYNETAIEASYFRTSHSPLRSQTDFINAFKNSLRIVKEINKFQTEDLKMFVFSPFYVFFVQYQHIVRLTFVLLGAAMAIIFGVGFLLLGSLNEAIVMTVTVMLILVNIGGVLLLWGVSLNAVSLVNLIICAGLAVEFCIHITRGYMKAETTAETPPDQDADELFDQFMDVHIVNDPKSVKAFNSLTTVGGSVLAGITLTKIIGIMVLAFTRSKIFETFYFRMWFSLIFIAAIHSLCLLPILLSLVGSCTS